MNQKSITEEIKITAKEMLRTVKILLRIEKPVENMDEGADTTEPKGTEAGKELRKLNRRELLEMLVEESRRNQELEERIRDLETRLEQRQVIAREAGSLAEAALKLNGVFEAAQAAADQYLDNLKQFSETQTERSEP